MSLFKLAMHMDKHSFVLEFEIKNNKARATQQWHHYKTTQVKHSRNHNGIQVPKTNNVDA